MNLTEKQLERFLELLILNNEYGNSRQIQGTKMKRKKLDEVNHLKNRQEQEVVGGLALIILLMFMFFFMIFGVIVSL